LVHHDADAARLAPVVSRSVQASFGSTLLLSSSLATNCWRRLGATVAVLCTTPPMDDDSLVTDPDASAANPSTR
jgi:hypothetical protein